MNTAEHTLPASGLSHVVPDTSTGEQEYLSFCLGDEEYGIDILKVQEIRSYESPTRMAGTPEFVKGVLNLRGVIVPVLDLRLRFGLTHAKYNAQTVTVILSLKNRVVGIVVDSVSDVVELTKDQIKPTPPLSAHVNSASIAGLGTIEHAGQERMMILLDIEQLMQGDDMGLASASVQ